MNCRQAEPLLSDYLEGLPWGRKAARLATHLSACPACRRLMEEFRAIGAELRAPLALPPLRGIEGRISERWLADRAIPAAKQGDGVIRHFLPRERRAEPRLYNGLNPAEAGSRSTMEQPRCARFPTRKRGANIVPSLRDERRQDLPDGSPGGRRQLGVRLSAPSRGFLMGAAGAAMLIVALGVRVATRRPAPSRSSIAPLPSAGQRLPELSPTMRAKLALRATRGLPVASPGDKKRAPTGWVGARPSGVRRFAAAFAPRPRVDAASGDQERRVPGDGLMASNGLRLPEAGSESGSKLPHSRGAGVAAGSPALVGGWGVRGSGFFRLPPPDDFVQVAPPLLADLDVTGRQIAAEASRYQRETARVDPRLARLVTLAVKGAALSDLCDSLRRETGIRLAAGPSVADEKVTVFCDRAPLRDIMRQLSGPFGYTWLRSGSVLGKEPAGPNTEYRTPNTDFRYELEQDLRSQLLEEQMRNRDRDAALLALDREVERCRQYLDLSPDEALARARSASGPEKKLLEQLAGTGWGAAQMYFRLSPEEMAELRAGRALVFGSNVTPDPLGRPSFDGRRTADALDQVLRPLPPEIARGTLQSLRDWRVSGTGGQVQFGIASDVRGGVPVTSWPGARPAVMLLLRQDERGQYTLFATAGLAFGPDETRYKLYGGDPLATGLSPSVARPNNRIVNASLSRDPALQPVITVEPQPSCGGFRSPVLASFLRHAPSPPSGKAAADTTPRKATTADVLEALHRATGLNLVADYYTRLYSPESVTLRGVKLFDALNQLADTMRMRWSKEGDWLRFRTTDYYNERLKEVPNRFLSRWAASHKQHGALTLDDLIEIAQLSDAQLDSHDMGEGAWLCDGLEEWFLASHARMRYHLRFLGGLTPTQRREAQSAAGLPFTQMSLPQQQGFLSLAVEKDDRRKLQWQDLAGASLRVTYIPAGDFEWARPPAPGSPPLPSPVLERTREAALAAARRIDPQADPTQIVPTDVDLVFLYTVSAGQRRRVAMR